MSPSPRTQHLATLIIVSALVACGLHAIYLPWWCGDSPGYAGPAWRIYHGAFAGYTGVRTPSYPLFLLLCECFGGVDNRTMTPLSGEIVTWVQSLLHIATAPLLYISMERLLIRPRIAFALVLLFALFLGVAQAQMLILCETLCSFLMVLSLCLATIAIDRLRRQQSAAFFALLSGLAFGAAILARPNIIFVWILFCAAIPALAAWQLVCRRPSSTAMALQKITRPCLTGGTVLLIVWLFVNYENTGVITLTPMTDVTRTSTAYNLFDRVHPEDKILGDIMVRYSRQTDLSDPRNHSYVWTAMPEIRAHAELLPIPDATSSNLLGIYRYLGRVSRYLLWENPGVWAQNSFDGFLQTFDFHFPKISPTEVTDPVSLTGTSVILSSTGWKIDTALTSAEAWLILPLYLLTFAAAALVIPRAFTAPDLTSALIPLTVASFAIGALLCMIAPCVLATYEQRFSIPLIPIFIISSGYALEILQHKRSGSRRPPGTGRAGTRDISFEVSDRQPPVPGGHGLPRHSISLLVPKLRLGTHFSVRLRRPPLHPPREKLSCLTISSFQYLLKI
jgi:hypothetical protein